MLKKRETTKKYNAARHFQNKHTAFAEHYPDGEERNKAYLMQKTDPSKNWLKKCMKSAYSTTYTSCMATQQKHEAVRRLNIYKSIIH